MVKIGLLVVVFVASDIAFSFVAPEFFPRPAFLPQPADEPWNCGDSRRVEFQRDGLIWRGRESEIPFDEYMDECGLEADL